MSMTNVDLRALSGLRDGRSQPGVATSATAIPPPRLRWKTRILVPSVIVASAVAILGVTAKESLIPSTPIQAVPVVAKSGGQGVSRSTVQAAGWVEPDPYPLAVPALADGIVRDVPVLEGARVEVGQLVATLVDDDAKLLLSQAEADLAQKHAAVEAARAALRAAEQNWANPIELTRQLSTSRSGLTEAEAELQRWPARLAVEQARAAELEAEWTRVSGLSNIEQTASIEVVRAQKQFEAQQALVKSMEGEKAILEAKVQSLKAEVEAAEQNLKLRIEDQRDVAEAQANLKLAEAETQAAAVRVDEARLRLDRMSVHSPHAGVVMTRLVEPGSKLMLTMDDPRSSQVVRIYDPEKLQVRVDIPLAEAAKVSVGQAAEISVGVLPNRAYHGRVTRVVHEADIQRNTLQVKVAIDDPSPELKPEMLARVRFIVESSAAAPESANRLFIPEKVISQAADGSRFVWRLDEKGTSVAKRAVTVGDTRQDDWVEIASGLLIGDQVAADHLDTLSDGQRVHIVAEAPAHH